MSAGTRDEMDDVAAARMLWDRLRVLRRHRPAERGLQPRAADARAGHRADLRIGHDRHAPRRAAAVDRRRRTGGDRGLRRAAAGGVQLLPARPGASTSASSAPRRSTASATSTAP